MSLKAMFGIFSSSGHHPHRITSGSASTPLPTTPGRWTFCATIMEENIASAEPIITNWDPSLPSSAILPPLFSHDREEARRFLRSVSGLQHAMLFFASDDSSAVAPSSRSSALVRAQNLMQAAMRRLEREFYQILSSNRDRLDPDSVSRSRSVRSAASSSDPDPDDADDDDVDIQSASISEVERASAVATDDLRSIADAMISAGYGRECVRIYRLLRKSIVDEGLYRLGFERLTASQLQKLDWDVLDLKIRSWLGASRVSVRTLFAGERILCDHVFAGSDSIREATFAEIARDSAAAFLSFPESVAKTKRSPEKLFRILDLYDAFIDLWPDVESIFSFDATSAVRSQALTSLLKLAESARATIAEFEAAIQKDATKAPAAAGGVHPLTRYVMNYLVFLVDYEESLADIFADFPFQPPTTLPDTFDAAGGGSATPPSPGTPRGGSFATRAAWLVLVLLCKMDGKAEDYKEVALSYLFLANNLQYIVGKVTGGRLRTLLGEQWVVRHQAKVRHYVASYERLAWAKVAVTIPAVEVSPAEAWERMKGFTTAFEEACTANAGWVVADGRVREEVRASVSSMIVPAYRAFYEQCREALRDTAVVRFAPEDVRNRLAELFRGSGESGSGSSNGSALVRLT